MRPCGILTREDKGTSEKKKKKIMSANVLKGEAGNVEGNK